MSKYTPSPPNSTEEEFADMIQCYIDSGKNIELTQMYYINRYPSRRRPNQCTVEKVVQEYLKTAGSNTTAEPHEEVTESPSTKDDRILKYFISNSQATIKKAASIFNVQACYIDKLLKDRKADLETMQNDYEILSEERSLNDHIIQNIKCKKSINSSKQNQSDAEEVMNINIKKEENNAENNQCDFNMCHIGAIKSEAPEDGVASKTSESEKPDITICSEISKRETDDDVIYCETITKKRKRKNKKSGVYKKQRTYESEDSSTLETPPWHNPIVYTTRLEEMAIFRKNITNFNTTRIINEILMESKPKYTVCRSNIQVRRIMSIRLLKKILRKLRKREAHVDLTHKAHNDSDEDDEPIFESNQIKTELINKKKIYTFNKKEEVVLDINRKCDVTIVINNLFANTYDIYVTDSKGNIIEYYCTKSNDYLKYIVHSKCGLIFDMCCWFQRQRRIESIWPRHEYTLSRFLTTTHKCPPDQCLCCCKIEKRATSPVVCHKSYDTNMVTDSRPILSDFSDSASKEYNRSLILSALSYNKREIKKTNSAFSKPINSTGKRFKFLEYFKQRHTSFVRNQYCEIGINQEIIRFHADSHVRDRSCCIRCGDLSLMYGEPISKLVVCCQWKRDSFLIEEYKASNISSNTLRFLRKTVFPPVCEICKLTLTVGTNKSANLDVVPRIEHSRISVKPTLLKIGVKVQTPPLANKPNYIGVKNITRQIPHCSNVMNEINTAASEVETSKLTSTVNLNVRCKEMPELIFEIRDVGIQIATMIVTKFKQMILTVKPGGKVVASLNSSIQSTTEEFQVFAHILQNIQNLLKRVPVSPGSSINLEMEIVNDKQNDCQTFENVNQDLDVACISANTRNDPNKGGLIKILPKQKTNINRNFNQYTTNKCDVDNLVISAKNNRFPPPSRVPYARNKNKAVNKRDAIIVTNKNEEFNTFAKVISCGKKYYAESFKSYLNAERAVEDQDVCVPKIISVFSLQQSKPTKVLSSPNESSDKLNNLDTVIPVPSTSKNDNVNNLSALLPPAEPPVSERSTGIIYDPITKVAQIVNLNPPAFVSNLAMPEANSSIMNENENVVLVNPLGMGEIGSSLAFLTPINTSSILLPYQSIHQKPILPDLINDIPISNYVMAETNHTVVKDELGDEVVILDSD